MSTLSKAKFAADIRKGLAGAQQTRNAAAVQNDAALPSKATPRTVNGDGTTTKPTTPAIIGAKKPVAITGGSPITVSGRLTACLAPRAQM